MPPFLEYVVEQYLWSDSLTAVSSLVSSKDRGLVEYLLELAMHICLQGFLSISESSKGMVIQIDPDSSEYWKYSKQKGDFEEFRPLIDWLIDWLFVVFRPVENISLILRRHHCRWRAANLDLCLALMAFSSEGSLACHTCCDTGPPFLRSYPKDPWFSLLNAELLAKEQSLPIFTS